jgi:hypothetical protein
MREDSVQDREEFDAASCNYRLEREPQQDSFAMFAN